MNRIHFALVVSSTTYRELIYSALSRLDVMFQEAIQEEEKKLCEYVKRNPAQISDYDALIIDLGALKDTDDEIMSAIESIRFFDDSTRIIILENDRKESYKLLHQCFLNGIYNLISADTFIKTRESLEKCILDGMSYKEALEFKEETRRETNSEEKSLRQRLPLYQRKEVVFAGTQHRAGTTHCLLMAAYTLMKNGYLTAAADHTGSADYLHFMKSYEQELNAEHYFTLDEVDFYLSSVRAEEMPERQSYNFVLYDFGCYGEIKEAQKKVLEQENVQKVLLTGSKPWELPVLSSVLRELGEQKGQWKYLFNFTYPGTENELRKMMRAAGIGEENLFFMEYQADFLSVSEVMKKMLGIVPQRQKKKLWFSKK